MLLLKHTFCVATGGPRVEPEITAAIQGNARARVVAVNQIVLGQQGCTRFGILGQQGGLRGALEQGMRGHVPARIIAQKIVHE